MLVGPNRRTNDIERRCPWISSTIPIIGVRFGNRDSHRLASIAPEMILPLLSASESGVAPALWIDIW